MDFEINFEDITLLEAEGYYNKVNELMNEEEFGGDSWMIRSSVTISSELGSSSFVVHFYYNRDVYIVDFESATRDALYNPDISCLSAWAQEYGWKIPQPHKDLVRNHEEFWKYFWETGIVNSDFLEKRLGKRDLDYLDDK